MESEALSYDDLANYPLQMREAFLHLTAKCRTASLGAKRHFIYPQVDEILDRYHLWLQTYGS